MVRLALMLISCVSLPIHAGGYLIVGAEELTGNQAGQPKWIALKKVNGNLIHLRVEDVIHEVEPGTYKVHHLDYQESTKSAKGTQRLEGSLEFSINPDEILYLGNIAIERRKKLLFNKTGTDHGCATAECKHFSAMVRLELNESLLQRACLKDRKLIEETQIRSMGSESIHFLSCSPSAPQESPDFNR